MFRIVRQARRLLPTTMLVALLALTACAGGAAQAGNKGGATANKFTGYTVSQQVQVAAVPSCALSVEYDT